MTHYHDPKVRDVAIRSCSYLTNAYKQGYIPPEALSWNDADDEQAFNHDMVTLGPPLGNDGKPIPAHVGAGGEYIPVGAKNVDVAKDLIRHWMQPKVRNENLKAGLGRWVPAIASLVKSGPSWLKSSDPHLAPYVQEVALGPTIPVYEGNWPAWGQLSAEQIFAQYTVG